MANFEVLVEAVKEVYDHPNADRLSIVKIRDYNCISAKLEDGSHRYEVGELVVYVPEGALVPEKLLRMGFWNEEKGQGILAGSKGNRVKALKLRDIVSQGIIFPIERRGDIVFVDTAGDKTTLVDGWDGGNLVGMDVTEKLGITKYEPEIPASMSGEVDSAIEFADNYDIENIKKYNEIFEDGEQVVFTEKLHGTNCRFIVTRDFIGVTSKGLGKQGLIFKNNEKNKVSNVYVKMLEELMPQLLKIKEDYYSQENAIDMIYIYGEIYGRGIQDLHYDATEKPKFRAFDVKYIWYDGSNSYLDCEDFKFFTLDYGIDSVPILYIGPFSKEKVAEFTKGKSSLGDCIREGIVVKPLNETNDQWVGRKFLKSVSEDYLTRKGSTTEYQ